MARRLLLGTILLIAVCAPPAFGQGVVSCTPNPGTLCIDPISWNIIGLDSNKPATEGPDTFMVGARACNYTGATLTDVTATYNTIGTVNTFINLADDSSITIDELKPDRCEDFYFNGRITRDAAAFDTTQQYQITVSESTMTYSASTPADRELYIEHLIDQNRNNVALVEGPTDLQVGGIYTFQVDWSTATGGYEQLEHFVNLTNTNFRLLSSTSTYAAPAGATNTTIYADACGWDNDLTSPTYRTCIGPENYLGGKAGGTVETHFTVQILGAGPGTLSALIYDFSGSSYHYNSDFNDGNGLAVTASAAADLQVTLTDTPDPVSNTAPSNTITYSGTVTNGGLSTVTSSDGMSLEIPIPAGTTYVTSSASMTGWSCGVVSGILTCTTTGDFAKGDSVDFSFQVTVDGTTPAGTIIPATATIASDLQDPVSSNNTASTSTIVADTTQADLVVTNTVLDPVVAASTAFSYTQTITNQGFADAEDVTFTTQVPAGATFNSITPPTDWSCVGPTGGTIVCTHDTNDPLAPGDSAQFILNVTSPASTGGTLSSTAYAETSTSEPTTANNIATASVGVVASGSADLAITVVDSPDPVVAGESILYTQTVTNNGTAPAINVVVTFPTPTDTVYSYIDFPTGWTCSTFPLPGSPTPGTAGTVTCTKPTMAVGETADFPLTVTVDAATLDGTLITYTATVSSDTTDSISANNTATVTTLVGAATDADVSITKTDSADPVSTGNLLTYTLVATNNGPADASNVTVSDALADIAKTWVSFVSATTTRGGCSGTGPVTCDLGTLVPGGTATITIQVTVDPNASGQTLSNTATISADENDPVASNDSATEETVVLSATLADFFDATAVESEGLVDLRWSTSYERDNLGFNVYRETGATRTLVNDSLIAGSAIIARSHLPAGFSYRWTDRSPTAGSVYWIESVALDGTTALQGPIVPGIEGSNARRSRSETSSSLTLEDLSTRPFDATLQTDVSLLGERSESSQDVVLARQFDLAGRPAAKILVKAEGYYRVTRRQLVAAGFDPGSDPKALALYVDANEIPILVDDGGDGRWDPEDAIEFFAVGMDSTYSGSRAYWLLKDNNGLRFKPKSRTKSSPMSATSFEYTAERKDRTIFFATQSNASDKDSFVGPPVYSRPTTQSLVIANVAPVGDASVEVSVQGATYVNHLVTVDLNGTRLGVIAFSKQELGRETFDIPLSLLQSGANAIVLRGTNGSSDISFIDYVRITYPHLYAADSGSLRFPVTGTTTATVTGFTTPDIRVIDVTDPLEPQEVEAKVSGELGNYTLTVTPHDKGERVLFAADMSRIATPSAIVANTPSSWSSQHNRADFVIITHPDFADAVQPLADLRTSQGIETVVVGVDDVFDEFGFGSKSLDSIRSFLAHTQERWKKAPRWVMLVGDATFDPRDYVGYGDRDLVPTRFVPTKYQKVANDDWLVDFDGDTLPDLYLGRLSVSNVAEAEAVVQKIIAYHAPATNSALIVVDKNDRTFSFADAATSIRLTIPADFEVDDFFVTSGSAGSRSALLAAILSNHTVINYIGHGSIEGWSNFQILRSADMPQLAGSGSTPFYVMMDCVNAYFADVYTVSLGEALLRTPNGGAVAVWASTGLSDPPPQVVINRALWRILDSERSITLGELVSRAKASTEDHEVRRTWMLLGDPTTRLFD